MDNKEWATNVLFSFSKELRNRSYHIDLDLQLYGLDEAIEDFKKVKIEYEKIEDFLREKGLLV